MHACVRMHTIKRNTNKFIRKVPDAIIAGIKNIIMNS